MRSCALLVLIFTFVQHSCETILDLETPEYEDQLVIGALLNNQDPYQEIILSITTGIDRNPTFINMTDSKVWLQYPDGREIQFMNANIEPSDKLKNFIINSLLDLKEGETYELFATKPGYDTLRGMTVLPAHIPLKEYNYTYDGGISLRGEKRSAVNILFDDPPNQKNFYRVGILVNTSEQGVEYKTYTSSLDPSVTESGDFDYALIEDSTFNGQSKSISLQFHKFPQNSIISLYVQWNVITEYQYNYDKTLRQYRISIDNPFSIPAQLHSGIENGIGFFGIENRVTYKVK